MHLEVIDALRCPAEHEESSLVASINRLEGRYIAAGSLGCPVCRARYPIQDFVAWFVPPGEIAVEGERPPRITEESLVRLAALLDTRVPGARYVLAGEWGWFAAALVAAYDVHCILVDPPHDVRPGEGISMLRTGIRVPLAAALAMGAALDERAGDSRARGLVSAVRQGGRIVAPVSLPLPEGARELARDATHWVGERRAPGVTVPLQRARR